MKRWNSPPLSRIPLYDLLYASLEIEADREGNRKDLAECESRHEAYKSGGDSHFNQIPA